MIKKTTILQNREVEYTLKKNLRTRRLKVAVYCDASVVVTAPTYFGQGIVERFLQAHASWLISRLDYFLKIGKTVRLGGNKREYKKYCEQARALVHKKIIEINKIYNFSYGRVAIKNQKTRWGSCSQKRNLNFNYRIVFLSDLLIDYLVTHELCHLQEFNHSRKFWELVSLAVPNYRECEKQIKKQVF